MSKLNGLYPFSGLANLQLHFTTGALLRHLYFITCPVTAVLPLSAVCVRICAVPSAQGMVREGLLRTVIRFMALVSI